MFALPRLLRSAALGAGLVAITVGCGASPPGDTPTPARVFDYRFLDADGVALDDDALTFPATPLGQQASVIVQLENIGAEPFTLRGSPPLRIDGDESSFFAGGFTVVTVPPQRPLAVTMRFLPDRLGAHDAVMTFETGLGQSAPFLLHGEGLEGDVTLGVRTRFYEGDFDLLPDFATLEPDVDTIQRTINIDVRDNTDGFAALFTSVLQVPVDGEWTFFTTADDGVQLLLDGAIVVDDDGLHGARERSGVLPLSAGPHPLEVRYFEKSGGETLEVRWRGPGVDKGLIPGAALLLPADAP